MAVLLFTGAFASVLKAGDRLRLAADEFVRVMKPSSSWAYRTEFT
jgi:hypothetical protein